MSNELSDEQKLEIDAGPSRFLLEEIPRIIEKIQSLIDDPGQEASPFDFRQLRYALEKFISVVETNQLHFVYMTKVRSLLRITQPNEGKKYSIDRLKDMFSDARDAIASPGISDRVDDISLQSLSPSTPDLSDSAAENLADGVRRLGSDVQPYKGLDGPGRGSIG